MRIHDLNNTPLGELLEMERKHQHLLDNVPAVYMVDSIRLRIESDLRKIRFVLNKIDDHVFRNNQPPSGIISNELLRKAAQSIGSPIQAESPHKPGPYHFDIEVQMLQAYTPKNKLEKWWLDLKYFVMVKLLNR